LRAGGFIFLPELHGEINVGHENRQKTNSNHPEERTKALEFGAVGVDRIRAKEDREIAEEVADDECHKGDASDSDDSFFANGGI
jgi:hypothetical protein